MFTSRSSHLVAIICVLLLSWSSVAASQSMSLSEGGIEHQKAEGSTVEFTPRNPLFAAAASALFPGGGQFYNQDIGKGVLVTAGEAAGAFLVLRTVLSHLPLDVRQEPVLVVLPITYALSIADAARSARKYNQSLVASGAVPGVAVDPQPRVSVGLEGTVMTGQGGAVLADIEWFATPSLSIGGARTVAVYPDELTIGSVRWYPRPDDSEQFFVGGEIGQQHGTSGYDYTLRWAGATVGLALTRPNRPWRWTAEVSAGSVHGVAGYTYRSPYVRWASGLGIRF